MKASLINDWEVYHIKASLMIGRCIMGRLA